MKVINEAAEMVPVADLKLHPRNVNQGDVGAIHQSIERNGFYGTIVAQKSSSFVASERMARVCYGMEIDPAYVAVILERLSGMGLEPRLTGETAEAVA